MRKASRAMDAAFALEVLDKAHYDGMLYTWTLEPWAEGR